MNPAIPPPIANVPKTELPPSATRPCPHGADQHKHGTPALSFPLQLLRKHLCWGLRLSERGD
jgi:hypothetical protein